MSEEPPSASAGVAELFVQEALSWLPYGEQAPPVATAATRGERIPGRVLIADDNPDLRQYLSRLLSPHWDVVTVGDGLEALELIREQPPDLLVTDVMMPGLDGFGLLRELRSAPETQGLPVIMLSARAGEEASIEGLDAGADDIFAQAVLWPRAAGPRPLASGAFGRTTPGIRCPAHGARAARADAAAASRRRAAGGSAIGGDRAGQSPGWGDVGGRGAPADA